MGHEDLRDQQLRTVFQHDQSCQSDLPILSGGQRK